MPSDTNTTEELLARDLLKLRSKKKTAPGVGAVTKAVRRNAGNIIRPKAGMRFGTKDSNDPSSVDDRRPKTQTSSTTQSR